MRGDEGFTLLEMLVVLAIVAMLAVLVLPGFRGSSPMEVDAYALRVAGLLKADRFAAIRSGAPVAVRLSLADRSIVSGRGANVVRIPSDMAFDAFLADRCGGKKSDGTIVFFPSGLSCGGSIALARPGRRIDIRVNWLTGGVEIVADARS